MRELLKKDLLYKVSAVVLALLLWFYVTNLQNPIGEKTITGVSVNYVGLPEGLIIGESTQTVEVKVKGVHSTIDPLTAKDIKVAVDLSKSPLGESSLLVNKIEAPAGVEVLSTKPQSINIYIDAIKEKQLPVKVEYLNSVFPGYTSYDPIITPSIVVVRGANKLLAGLETARVTVDLSNATKNLELSLPVQLLEQGNKVAAQTNLEISPNKIQVFLPVVQDTPTRTVIIKPVLTGKPKEGYVVTRTIVEPETMKITGPADKIDKIDQISTRPIDITDFDSNRVIQASLEIPEGVNLLYQPTAKVLLQIEAAPVTKTITDIPITLENQTEGLQAVLSKDKIAVTVKGNRAEIASLTAADIKALVNLQGLTEGTHQQDVKVVLPTNIQLVKLEPSSIEIQLSFSAR